MEKPNSLAVQLGAFDSMIRAILHVTGDDQLKEIHKYLLSLWNAIESGNPRPEAAEQLKASRIMAIGMIESALKSHSSK